METKFFRQFENLETPEKKLENFLTIEKVAELAEEIEEEGKTLGEGHYGAVKTLPDRADICMKKCKINSGDENTPIREIDFLERAKEMGVRVPTPRALAFDEKNAYLFMDTIHGISLERILNSENPLDMLPENFDYKTFNEAVSEEIKRINEEIHHKDIKPGNIMVDSDSNPVIIDFGQSKWAKEVKRNEHTTYGGDITKLRQTMLLFGKHIKQHGYQF